MLSLPHGYYLLALLAISIECDQSRRVFSPVSTQKSDRFIIRIYKSNQNDACTRKPVFVCMEKLCSLMFDSTQTTLPFLMYHMYPSPCRICMWEGKLFFLWSIYTSIVTEANRFPPGKASWLLMKVNKNTRHRKGTNLRETHWRCGLFSFLG